MVVVLLLHGCGGLAVDYGDGGRGCMVPCAVLLVCQMLYSTVGNCHVYNYDVAIRGDSACHGDASILAGHGY